MDHPLVIFDSSDEMIFSPEPTAINSNIHFQIHRLSAAGAVTSEEHYKILNDLFGTPAYSPDPDEDEDMLTSGISLSTPKRILPEFQGVTRFLLWKNEMEMPCQILCLGSSLICVLTYRSPPVKIYKCS